MKVVTHTGFLSFFLECWLKQSACKGVIYTPATGTLEGYIWIDGRVLGLKSENM